VLYTRSRRPIRKRSATLPCSVTDKQPLERQETHSLDWNLARDVCSCGLWALLHHGNRQYTVVDHSSHAFGVRSGWQLHNSRPAGLARFRPLVPPTLLLPRVLAFRGLFRRDLQGIVQDFHVHVVFRAEVRQIRGDFEAVVFLRTGSTNTNETDSFWVDLLRGKLVVASNERHIVRHNRSKQQTGTHSECTQSIGNRGTRLFQFKAIGSTLFHGLHRLLFRRLL
jgi:hypothetical protein